MHYMECATPVEVETYYKLFPDPGAEIRWIRDE